MEYIKSPFNYTGGKFKLLNQIEPLFPKNINVFLDMFSGGCNVGINVNAKSIIFNDMNYLINGVFRFFYASDVEQLIDRIKARIKEAELSKTNQQAFLNFRSNYNDNPHPLDLYILMAHSYNYQFRFNNSMKFNNPFGKDHSNFSINMENNLRKFITKLQSINATFSDQYFNDVDLSCLGVDDFVYLDPPYLITSASYNDGNRGFLNWTIDQECKLYEMMDELNNKGIKFAMSNVLEHKGKVNSCLLDYVRKSKFNVKHLNHSYNNSSYNTVRKGSDEVLITNYDFL